MFLIDENESFPIQKLIWTRGTDQKDVACVCHTADNYLKVFILLYDKNPNVYIVHTGGGENRIDCSKDELGETIMKILKKVLKRTEINLSDTYAIKQS